MTGRASVLLLLIACRSTNTDPDPITDTGDTGPDLPLEDVDNDGDGFTENDGDCDDQAATVHPEGVEGEIADGRDNDCNGIVDDMPSCPGKDKGIDTLQAAIDAAPEGMTLVICPGTYEEMLTVDERSVGIWAEEGPEKTIIQGDQSGTVFTISGSDGMTISGFSILGGRGLGNGGAIQATNSTVDFRDNIFLENQAVGWGGGIYCESCVGSITGNTIQGSRAAHGGGIAINYGKLDISGNSILENTSYSTDGNIFGNNYGGGGGILIVGDSSFNENLVESNYSGTHGGGLYIVQGEGEVRDNTFQLNSCAYDGAGVLTNLSRNHMHGNLLTENTAHDDGGGMRVYVGGMTIENNEFIANTAAAQGGAMKVSHAANTIIGNLIEGNTAGEAGGGIELDNDSSRVENNVITGNTAYRGGGLHSWYNEEEVWIVGNEISNNVATWCGGGVEADQDYHTVTLLRNQITGNDAPYGGALCTYNYVDLVVENTLIAHNNATTSGGATYFNQGDTRFVNTVFYGNTGIAQPGIYSYYGTISMVNSVLMAHDPGHAWYLEGTTTDIHHNIFYENVLDLNTESPSEEDGNLFESPLFADSKTGDWTLLDGSPGVDAGDPKILDTDGSRSDIGLHGGPEAD
jgi:predicted outer membrane repeat protein